MSKDLKLKDKLKLSLYPHVSNLVHRTGLSWPQIGDSKLGKYSLIGQARSVVNSIKYREKKDKLDIVFLTMLGGHFHNVSVDVVLGLGLYERGHQITSIIDDGIYPIHEMKYLGREEHWNLDSARQYAFGKKYLEAAGFQVLRASSIVDMTEEVSLEGYDDILEASLFKHYKVGILKPQLPDLAKKKRLVEKSLEFSVQIGNYLVNRKPDMVIMSHGIYSTWGPQFRILKNSNIPILAYSKTKKKHTEKFTWNHTADWWEVGSEWQNSKDIALTIEEEEKLDSYLHSRVSHKDDVLIYNFGKKEDRNETIERFNLDPNKPIFSLFTNVLWDASSTQREIAFNNPIEWVLETISWFKEHPDKQLIVKIHPAEIVIGTNMPFIDIIKENISELASNIRIIEPDEEVNSWSIYSVTDLGIVHTTTVGMELPLMGIPTLVVSKTHFRAKGFTIDIDSKESYFEAISNFSGTEINRRKLIELSRRYAYLLFERYQVPFDVFYEPTFGDVRALKFASMEELKAKPYYKYIIDCIENKLPVIINE